MRERWRQGLRGTVTFLTILMLGCLAALRAAEPAAGRVAGDLPGFLSESVVQGLDFPTSFAFGPDGRIYIAEKSGLVRVAISGTLQAVPFLDLRDDVNNTYDRGLLAIELHPDFPDPPYVYLLHTHDPDDTPRDGPGARVSRLLRVEADRADLNIAASDPASRTVLLGASGTLTAIPDIFRSGRINFPTCVISGTPIQDCVPSDAQTHSIGGLGFANDGTLYVSMGDGANASQTDIRSRRSQDLDTLAGKVLRIDPLSGEGYPDNPFYDGNPNSNRSKVAAYGLRNPFRITVKDTGGRLIIGDVGFETWEEIDLGTGRNFGWPCYEGGPDGSLAYAFTMSPTLCEGLLALGTGAVQTPSLAYDHAYGRAIMAGPILSGTAYPGISPEEMAVADFDAGWIRLITVTADNRALIREWVTTPPDLGGVTQLRVGPDGFLYYCFYSVDAGGGEIRRVRYAPGENLPPVAKLQAAPDRGDIPLTTTLTAFGSYDPEGQPMTYTWSLGNGETAAGAWATAVFTSAGRYTVTLVVTDPLGASASRSMQILAGSVPTLTVIAPSPPATFTASGPVMFAGRAWDPQDGDVSASIHWTADLYHANHVHLDIFDDIAASGVFTAPDHDMDVWIRLCAQAVDSDGLASRQTCVALFEDIASGLYLPIIGRNP